MFWTIPLISRVIVVPACECEAVGLLRAVVLSLSVASPMRPHRAEDPWGIGNGLCTGLEDLGWALKLPRGAEERVGSSTLLQMLLQLRRVWFYIARAVRTGVWNVGGSGLFVERRRSFRARQLSSPAVL